jgi:hypothetical protein
MSADAVLFKGDRVDNSLKWVIDYKVIWGARAPLLKNIMLSAGRIVI